tara:strand:- start:6322 stop:6885 length:564 start_codon:yes stop_codon:yes gene_type:complete
MTFEELLPKLIYSAVSIIVILIVQGVAIKLVNRFVKNQERVENRTNLIKKYFNFAFVFLLVFWNILIWGVQFSDVGLVFSSVFAIIGVALFAQWSILSNVTSGIIMFFTFPFKIGDTIKIHDKDFFAEPLIIEDINAFQTLLKSENGELLCYPNNMILQKGITLVSGSDKMESTENKEDKNLTKTHD